MDDEINDLIKKAEEHMITKDVSEAGKSYERVAALVSGKKDTVKFLKKAAQAYDKLYPEDAVRCYLEAGKLLEKKEKAECYLECFGVYVWAIASCEWECCFEWRGETDGTHDDDHELYQTMIKNYQDKAEGILNETLNIEGVKRNKIIRKAKKICKGRKKDGWGLSKCLEMVVSVTGEK